MKKNTIEQDKPKTERLEIRLSKKQLAYVNVRAKTYADGDLSAWVRHCLFNYKPKKIKDKK